MARPGKFDTAKMLQAYNDSRSKTPKDVKDMLKSLFGMNEKQASTYSWKLRAGKVAPRQQSTPQTQGNATVGELDATNGMPQVTIQPQSISVKDINVTAQPVKEEAKELSETYRAMVGSGAGGSEIPQEDIGEQDESSGGAPPPMGGAPELKIKLGSILKIIGIQLNDGLIWRERPLAQDEKDMIEETSKDIETKFGGVLNNPNAPYINYLLSVIVLPAATRLDLLLAKVQNLQKKGGTAPPFGQRGPDKQAEPQRQNSNQNASWTKPFNGESKPEPEVVQTVPEPAVVSGATPINARPISENAKDWLLQLEKDGYHISPAFGMTGTTALDVEAYKDLNKKIVRNPGDSWMP